MIPDDLGRVVVSRQRSPVRIRSQLLSNLGRESYDHSLFEIDSTRQILALCHQHGDLALSPQSSSTVDERILGDWSLLIWFYYSQIHTVSKCRDVAE